MSEYEPMDMLRKVSPEAAASMDDFDAHRHQLYDWFAVQTIELPELETVVDYVNERMFTVGEKFSEAAISVHQNVDSPEVAGYYIGRKWLGDCEERLKLFNSLMPYVEYEPFQGESMVADMNAILKQYTDPEKVQDWFVNEYHSILIPQVRQFFFGIDIKRRITPERERLVPYATDEETFQIEPPAVYLQAVANKYGLWVLKSYSNA